MSAHSISFHFDAHIYYERIDQFEDRPDNYSLQPEIEVLRLEENTWELLQALMPSVSPSILSLIRQHLFNPTKESSSVLTELIVVREWLQETAPTPSPPEANTGYWKFTKHTIMQSIRAGHTQRDGWVTEMDPDAVN